MTDANQPIQNFKQMLQEAAAIRNMAITQRSQSLFYL